MTTKLLIGMFLIFGTQLAWANGEKILKKMDDQMIAATDQRFKFKITTKIPGKAKRSMTMQVTIKGTQWRRVDFLSPGDVKGMKILIRSSSQMYVYLPAYRKVRRVASHVRDQGFMGTVYNHDDMSVVTYGNTFKGKLIKETEKHWVVEGTKRAGKEFSYAKVIFTIRKDINVLSKIQYFNAKGENVKSEERLKYTCKNKICNPWFMKLTDHTRNDSWTSFTCKHWEVNTGIADRYFSVRSLQRGR